MSEPPTKERPILFSGPMVRAILDGRKSVTRRIVKSQPTLVGKTWVWPCDGKDCKASWADRVTQPDSLLPFCPYGLPGDAPDNRLWVREAWRTESSNWDTYSPSGIITKANILYDADADWRSNKSTGRTRSPIHMPRWASRITLEVSSVRVERLQAIRHNAPEFEAEGIELPPSELFPDQNRASKLERHFTAAWESINGKGSWASNPWVWCVAFNRVEATP